jgi:hypothetical protein
MCSVPGVNGETLTVMDATAIEATGEAVAGTSR